VRNRASYRYYLLLEAALSLPPFVVIALFFVKTVHLDPLQLVLVGTVMEVSIFVFEIPTGVVADLYGRKRSLVIAWLVMGVGTVVVGAVPHFWGALAGWAVWGFGATFMSGAYEAWITDEVGPEHVGPVFARGQQVSYAAAIAGMPLFIGLASVTSLRTSVLVGGALTVAVALVSIPLMPETAFVRPERTERTRRVEMLATAATGARLVRGRPVLLLLLGTAFFAGAYSEGFDRLWEAHFIRDVGLPSFAGLSDLWWFALLGVGALLAGLLATGVLVKRIKGASHGAMARILLGLTSLQILTMIGFGLAGSFALAVVAFLAAKLARSLVYPVYMTWLNQSIDNSSVRATVISIAGQSDAIGQVAGGPGVGAIGSGFGIRAALVASGVVLTPALALYGRALRRHADLGLTPELEDQSPAAA